MRKIQSMLSALALVLMCAMPVAVYAQDAAPQDLVEVTTGGVGEDGMASINEVAASYSLKMVFTGNGGEYLSDADVTVKDAKGKIVVQQIVDGPVLLAKLVPGNYTAVATIGNLVRTEHFPIFKSKKTRTVHMRFALAEERESDAATADTSTSDADTNTRKIVTYNADKSCTFIEEFKDGNIVRSKSCKIKRHKK